MMSDLKESGIHKLRKELVQKIYGEPLLPEKSMTAKVTSSISEHFALNKENGLDRKTVAKFLSQPKANFSDTTLNTISRFVTSEYPGGPFTFQAFLEQHHHTLESSRKPLIKENIHLYNDNSISYWPLSLRLALGGGVGGLLTSGITIYFRNWIGYQNIDADHFYSTMPLVFLGQIIAGAIGGYFLGKYLEQKSYSHWLGSLRDSTFLIVSSFPFFFLLRQMAVRDALVPPGGYLDDRGGPLGEPEFESMATALAASIGLWTLVRFLKKAPDSFLQIFIYSLINALYTGLTFALIFLIYRVSISTGLLEEGQVLFQPYVFKVGFSHPERVFWFPLFGFIFSFLLLSISRSNQSC